VSRELRYRECQRHTQTQNCTEIKENAFNWKSTISRLGIQQPITNLLADIDGLKWEFLKEVLDSEYQLPLQLSLRLNLSSVSPAESSVFLLLFREHVLLKSGYFLIDRFDTSAQCSEIILAKIACCVKEKEVIYKNKGIAVKDALALSGWNQILSVNSNCPRYLVLSNCGEYGLGHRFAAFIFALLVAQQTNSTFVVPRNFWSEKNAHTAAGYPWMSEFLRNFEIVGVPNGTLTRRFAKKDELVSFFKNRPCKSAALADTGYYQFCNGWCLVNWWDAFKLTRPLFLRLKLYENIRREILSFFNLQGTVCSWHIRVGDVQVSNSKALIRLMQQVDESSKRGLTHLVLSSLPLCVGPSLAFCEFKEFASSGGRSFFRSNFNESDVFQFLMASNVLVATGSSFAFAAAQMSSSSQIILMMPAKEHPQSTKVYSRGDAFLVDQSGLVLDKEKFLQRMSFFDFV